MARLALYSIFVVIFSLFAHVNVVAQSPGQVQLDITARDHYTRIALDSVALAIYFDGMLLDSTVTGPDGRALMNFAVSLLDGPGEMPSGFTLSSNYPNPFHNETRVDMGVPESQPVRIEIFNILGQRVASQSLQLDAGRYALNLTMGHLPVGVYFLRVAGRDAKVEKMVKMGRSFSSPGPVFRMEPLGTGNAGRPVIDRKAGSDYMLSSEEGYLLRAWRDRYQNFETSPEIEGNPAELLVEMRRNNIVSLVTVDPGEEPVSRQVRITGEQVALTINTPDTLILASGIYTVVSTTDSLFAVNDVFEIVSRDSAYVIRPFIPSEAEISGRVASDQLEFVAGAQVRVYRDGSEYASTVTDADGYFSTTLLADGGMYSLVIYPPAANGHFDPLTHSGFSPDARVITPHPGGSYELSFLLYTEPALALPGGGTDLPTGNYTLATDGGTVMVANIPPDLGIVGGTARAYSPTLTPDAFPGEFATRQQGVESGLVSGGFASVNLLRSDGAGGVEPISELRDSTGNRVEVELRFRIDPADYNVIRDPATLSDLPGFINRTDTIDVPLYYYNEELGDWRLTPQFGWLENEQGAIPMSELQAIQEGTYQGAVYMVGVVDHFTWYNLDYPARDACVTGRILDQNSQPVVNATLTISSMPESPVNSFFSNIIKPVSNTGGYFQARVPRTETGPSDDWNNNNKTDFFRFQAVYEDKIACAISIFDEDGTGYLTPFFPEESGCRNLGTLRVSLKEAKRVNFNIRFLDIEREGQPDYPLFVSEPSMTGFNYSFATLLDNRIPLMGDVWKCICESETAFQICNYQATTDATGRAQFSLPVLESDPDLPLNITEMLTGNFSYRKQRPDLGFGAYEFASCGYLVPENQRNRTIRCEVERRGPPIVVITRIATDEDFDGENPFQVSYLYDDMVVIEAEGEDVNGNLVEIFYWTDQDQLRVVAGGKTARIQASRLFGTGENLGIMAHGIDYYGWRGTDLASGIDVAEVSVDITPNRTVIVPGDTTLISSVVTGANNRSVTWSVNNTSIAAINAGGILTAREPGEVTITGRSVADPTSFAQTTVEVANLVAVFTVDPQAGDSTTVFTFDGTGSIGDISAYAWNFGDGNTAIGAVVQHSYGSGGVYTTELTVTGQFGLTASTARSVSATGEPVAVINADPVSGNPPLLVQFDGSASVAVSGTITEWIWDFGDGETDSGISTEYTYTEVGQYMAQLTVTDDTGRTGTDSVLINVSSGPVALFTVEPVSGTVPLQVTVDASESEGEIVRYSWNFGDGTELPDGAVMEVHTYTTAGSFEIILEVEDITGQTDQHIQTVTTGCDDFFEGNITISQSVDLSPLLGICGINGNLTIQNTDLENLNAFSDLVIISGELRISNNQSLVSLAGIGNVVQVDRLVVRDNPLISSLEVFFNLIVHASIEIINNAGLIEIGGFEPITSLTGNLFVADNTELLRLTGFNNLVSVNQMNIVRNRKLTELNGFKSLKTVASTLWITNLDELETITGFGELENVNQLQLQNNAKLVDLSFLDDLTGSIFRINITGNASLSRLFAFNKITEITDFIVIVNNASLLELSAFDQLQKIAGVLMVRDNPSLESLNAFHALMEIENRLQLTNNASLTDFNAFAQLGRVGGDLMLFGNNMSHCRVAELAWLIDGREGIAGDRQIFGNLDEFSGNITVQNAGQLQALDGICGVNGNLVINGSGISELVALDSLRTVSQALVVSSTSSLQSLNGLNNLLQVRRLDINFNNQLSDILALGRLRTVTDLVQLTDISAPDLSGLSNLRRVGQLSLMRFPELQNFSGLENLREINSHLFIQDMPKLTSLAGLENLESAQSVTLQQLPLLTSSSPLASFERTQRIDLQMLNTLADLTLFTALREMDAPSFDNPVINLNNLPALASLNGLQNLTSAPFLELGMTNLPVFTSFAGLDNLDEIWTMRLTQLGQLTSLSSLGNLSSLNTVVISQMPGLVNLNGLEHITSINTLVLNQIPALTNLVGLGGLTSLNTLSITGNPVFNSFEGLPSTIESPIRFNIENNAALQNLNGLEWLESAESITIRANQGLTTLQGLNNLSYLGGNLELLSNNNLTSLEALSNLTQMRQFSTISINNTFQLTSLNGLGNIDADSLISISLFGVRRLKNLEGLENFHTLNQLTINSNDSLQSLSGLENLKWVENGLTIQFNNRLTNLEGLSGVERAGFMTVSSNPALLRVTGMTALSRVNGSFGITNNTNLPACDAEVLRDQIQGREGIGGNINLFNNTGSGSCPP